MPTDSAIAAEFGFLNEVPTDPGVLPESMRRLARLAAFRQSLETGGHYEIEHRRRRTDGVYRWFHVRALPVRDKEGGTADWHVLLTNLDDPKRAEEAPRASEHNLHLIVDTMQALRCRLGAGEYNRARSGNFQIHWL
jgi:PAS fold